MSCFGCVFCVSVLFPFDDDMYTPAGNLHMFVSYVLVIN